MRSRMNGLAQAALIASAAGVLAGCGPSGSADTSNQASESSAADDRLLDRLVNKVLGVIEVERSLHSCDVTVKIHNATKNHLNNATFGITGLDGDLTTKDVIAGGTDSQTLNVSMPYNGSCLAIAQKVEVHATDNNVGTCNMDGASEGDCQRFFAFQSGIDRRAIQADIDKLKTSELKVGDTFPSNRDFMASERDEDEPHCKNNESATWSPEIADILRDGDGVAIGYQISATCPGGETLQRWMSRSEQAQ